MKKVRILICLVALLATTSSIHAGDFTLTGTEHLDVTTTYDRGVLYDFSSANVLPGGSVNTIIAIDSSIVNITGGSAQVLNATDNSTVNVSSGSFDSYLTAGDNSTLNFSDASAPILAAFKNSTVNITGGSVGYVNAYNLWFNGPQSIPAVMVIDCGPLNHKL